MANVTQVLAETVREGASRIALVEGERRTAYGELAARAEGYRTSVLAEGVEPGDRVAIGLPRGSEAAAAFFGIVAAGAIAVFVHPVLRRRQVEHILEHSEARLLVDDPGTLPVSSRPVETPVPTLTPDQVRGGGPLRPASTDGDALAQLVYTSGSTGPPKGVMVTHGNLGAGVRAVTTYLDIDREDRLAALLPFAFDYGLNQLLCAVAAGATLVVERSPMPQRVVRTLRRTGVTVLAGVPPLWLQLLAVEAFREGSVDTLRILTNTGGRLPRRAVRELARAYGEARLFLMYGLTEAFRSTYLDPEELDRRPDSVGKAIPGAEILVVDQDLEPCGPGEVGELVHAGPTVTRGYWRDPEATARVFRPHPFAPGEGDDAGPVVFSGDLVKRDGEGFLYFVGRRDSLIKCLGYRVSPDEVAEVLHDSGLVREAAVGSEPDELMGEAVVAHVRLAEDTSLERLEAFCRRALPRHMRPARFRVWKKVPTTPSGKFAAAGGSGAPV